MKTDLIWAMSVPPTALFHSPTFAILPKRECQITIEYEGEEGDHERKALQFSGCESFRCTYMNALSPEQIKAAYGKVVSIPESAWLSEIVARLSQAHVESMSLRHFMICFDDGPCYEFICRKFVAN